MLALWIVLAVLLVIIYIIMTSIMVIFERDKPRNIIIWSSVFLITQFIGYIIYFCSRMSVYNKKKALNKKIREDEIYFNLISNKLNLNPIETNETLYKFNNRAFNTCLNSNSKFEMFDSLDNYIKSLINNISVAKTSVLIELSQVNLEDFIDLKNAIINKAKENVLVKFVYDLHISRKTKKELKLAGVKIYKFNKHNPLGRLYSNLRNMISIDGEIIYSGSLDFTSKQKKSKFEKSYSYLRFEGDVVQSMNVSLYQDVVFAGGKYIEYPEVEKSKFNETKIQFASNEINSDIELLIINAICLAKKSIQLQLEQFVPTKSITSLLRYAINSNIEVRLMIPMKSNRYTKYFASRAYTKELALFGASVYLYDGYIRFNAITIDDNHVLTGSYIIDREHINSTLQNVVIIEDKSAVDYYNNIFNKCIDNSYKVNNAKYLLLREKIFKSLV